MKIHNKEAALLRRVELSDAAAFTLIPLISAHVRRKQSRAVCVCVCVCVAATTTGVPHGALNAT